MYSIIPFLHSCTDFVFITFFSCQTQLLHTPGSGGGIIQKNMNTTNILGYAASLLIIVAFIPQTYQVIKTKQVRDVSLGTFGILCVGSAFWIAYGLFDKDYPIVLTNVFTCLLYTSPSPRD